MAPRAGPLRAIAIRPQVALPACRALLTSASLTDAHLPTVTRHPAVPMVTRPADSPHASTGLVHQVVGQHFEPGPQRPGVKRGRSRTRLAGFPVSGEQCRVGSRDRRTPTVPLTLRDQAFDPAKRAVPPICAAVPVHWVTVVAAPNWHFWAAIWSRRRSAISDVCSRPRLGSGSRRSGSSIRTTCESACARPRGVNSPTVSAAPSTAGTVAGLRRLRTPPAARRPASAIAALPGSS